MVRDVYTADMGNPPVEQDGGSIAPRKRPMAPPAAMPRRPAAPPAAMPRPPMAGGMGGKRPMADPADAGVYTADKGQPPSPDEGPTMMRRRPKMKAGGCVKKMASGGKVGSASKRADGCATKGKTKGKFV